jgi:thiamine-phosphate pyrophosphorylase
LKKRVNFSLYLVTDSSLSLGRPIASIVEAAARGGVSAVQLREKSCPADTYIGLARDIKKLLAPFGIPLMINDRVDVALAAGADGVHLGQSDMPAADARKMFGPAAIIGLSVETLDQAAAAENLDVDYLGVSPIFRTPTKADTGEPWGLNGLRKLRALSRHRLVAIGGIDSSNAERVLAAGADGLAVVSAICAAANPEAAARLLHGIIARHKIAVQGRE